MRRQTLEDNMKQKTKPLQNNMPPISKPTAGWIESIVVFLCHFGPKLIQQWTRQKEKLVLQNIPKQVIKKRRWTTHSVDVVRDGDASLNSWATRPIQLALLILLTAVFYQCNAFWKSQFADQDWLGVFCVYFWDDELESCCVCLDALSTSPAILIATWIVFPVLVMASSLSLVASGNPLSLASGFEAQVLHRSCYQAHVEFHSFKRNYTAVSDLYAVYAILTRIESQEIRILQYLSAIFHILSIVNHIAKRDWDPKSTLYFKSLIKVHIIENTYFAWMWRGPRFAITISTPLVQRSWIHEPQLIWAQSGSLCFVPCEQDSYGFLESS